MYASVLRLILVVGGVKVYYWYERKKYLKFLKDFDASSQIIFTKYIAELHKSILKEIEFFAKAKERIEQGKEPFENDDNDNDGGNQDLLN